METVAVVENGKNPFDLFVEAHKNQLTSSVVPQTFWKALYSKLSRAEFDAGKYFTLAQEDEDGPIKWKVLLLEDMSKDNENMIFLIDHAWTFRPSMARHQLETVPGLLNRMTNLMDIPFEEDSEECIESVMNTKWKYAWTYALGNAATVEERMPIWYIHDEFGSRIGHSDKPNFRLVPFFSMIDGSAYSLLFPVEDSKAHDEVTRDFVEGEDASRDAEMRRALLTAWNSETDFSESLSWKQCEPDPSFFETRRETESLPDPKLCNYKVPSDRKLKVYVEYDVIRNNLHHPRIEIVEDMSCADVLWLFSHFKEYKEFSETFPDKLINQFPFENVLTIKDFLCIISRRMREDSAEEGNVEESSPEWLPVTYNLKTELPQFISYYQSRAKKGLDNHWIVKPWNLARGLDMHITPHLHTILRLPLSGPKIAQKYLHDPVLFHRPGIGGVKFDIRYIVLLQSVTPLKVYVYNRFWLRFANQPFELTKFDVYQKHYTVMNYDESSELKQMFCSDFIKDFEGQYPGHKWSSDIEPRIFKMLREVFEGATRQGPPGGIAHSPQSRAMYAVDLMLDWKTTRDEMSPKILEVNFSPDCERAATYYPEFFDNVFSTLFLHEDSDQNVTLL